MKKTINKELTFYFKPNFPFKNSFKSSKKNKITIGIGGNVGDVVKTFNKLFLCLAQDSRFFIEKTSPILKNPPFGFLDQDDFLNSIMVLRTNLSVYESLRAFQKYEKRFKRKRSFQDAPRTLDVDIIFFNSEKLNTENLIVPHKDYKNRPSVLLPLKLLPR